VGQNPSQQCDESRSKYANLEGMAVKKVEPEYPAEPGFHVEGKVTVRIVIDKKGNVVSAKAICGHPLIMAPAIKAAAQWQFQPKRVNGRATKNIGVIVFVFKDVNRDRSN
jgi:TonB family protein